MNGATTMTVRELVLGDLGAIDQGHLEALGLALRAPAQLRVAHTPSNVLPFAGSLVDATHFDFVLWCLHFGLSETSEILGGIRVMTVPPPQRASSSPKRTPEMTPINLSTPSTSAMTGPPESP